jgi:hypothetical protein
MDCYEHVCDKAASEEVVAGSIIGWRERATPIYVAIWAFCPYCGVRWEGPVRSDVDNSLMLGPRRLRIWQLQQKHPTPREPAWYWVLLREYKYAFREDSQTEAVYKFNPDKNSALAMAYWLQNYRNNETTCDNTYSETYRLTTVRNDDKTSFDTAQIYCLF